MSDVCSAATGAGRQGRAIMKALATIPILRIFDVPKALEFYRDYLGFTVDWEHRFDSESPAYMQVSRGGLVLHLSEHYGDATPGSTVYVSVEAVRRFQEELAEKKYGYLPPGIERTPWGSMCMELIDPFGNRLRLDEKLKE
jgi:uncharacterized glyoxalase superfamily protein PhnB